MIAACSECGKLFADKSSRRLTCSAKCKRAQKARYARRYAIEHAEEIRAYRREWQAQRRRDPLYRDRENERDRKRRQRQETRP